jgi:hypothetical protein
MEETTKDSNIVLHFGNPLLGEVHEIINTCAINHDLSFELATIKVYKHLVGSLSERKKDGRCYFDHLLADCFQKDVILPKIEFVTTRDKGVKFPSLILGSDFAIEVRNGKKLFIQNSSIDYVGNSFGAEFDIEYLGYERKLGYSKRSISPQLICDVSRNPMIAEKWQTIYLLGDKRHIFDGEQFIEVA